MAFFFRCLLGEPAGASFVSADKVKTSATPDRARQGLLVHASAAGFFTFEFLRPSNWASTRGSSNCPLKPFLDLGGGVTFRAFFEFTPRSLHWPAHSLDLPGARVFGTVGSFLQPNMAADIPPRIKAEIKRLVPVFPHPA